MTEIRHKNAIVRIHGNPNREKIEAATIKFLKATKRKKKVKNNVCND